MAIVRLGQAQHMGKWESHSAMIRVVRDLVHRLEDGEDITESDKDDVNNVLYGFLAQLPQKVRDEVKHG